MMMTMIVMMKFRPTEMLSRQTKKGKQKEVETPRANLAIIFFSLMSRYRSSTFCQNNNVNFVRSYTFCSEQNLDF